MELLSVIVALVAIGFGILAYRRAGGIADLKKQIDHFTSSVDLRKSVDTLSATVDTLREKTADALGKLEETIRTGVKEEGKPPKASQPEAAANKKQGGEPPQMPRGFDSK